ncbi:MAG: hypothetical protein QXU99_05880, partial [Candidatus Bathyarchaeia archaeon]
MLEKKFINTLLKNHGYSMTCEQIEDFDLELPGVGYLKRLADKDLKRKMRMPVGFTLEPIKIGKKRMQKIAKILGQSKGSLEDRKEAAAFKLAGLPYMTVEEAIDFFEENPEKLFKFMEAYQEVDLVFDKL